MTVIGTAAVASRIDFTSFANDERRCPPPVPTPPEQFYAGIPDDLLPEGAKAARRSGLAEDLFYKASGPATEASAKQALLCLFARGVPPGVPQQAPVLPKGALRPFADERAARVVPALVTRLGHEVAYLRQTETLGLLMEALKAAAAGSPGAPPLAAIVEDLDLLSIELRVKALADVSESSASLRAQLEPSVDFIRLKAMVDERAQSAPLEQPAPFPWSPDQVAQKRDTAPSTRPGTTASSSRTASDQLPERRPSERQRKRRERAARHKAAEAAGGGAMPPRPWASAHQHRHHPAAAERQASRADRAGQHSQRTRGGSSGSQSRRPPPRAPAPPAARAPLPDELR